MAQIMKFILLLIVPFLSLLGIIWEIKSGRVRVWKTVNRGGDENGKEKLWNNDLRPPGGEKIVAGRARRIRKKSGLQAEGLDNVPLESRERTNSPVGENDRSPGESPGCASQI